MEIVKFDSKVSWTVAIACACLNFLVLIPTKVSGLFFLEILDRYEVSRSTGGYPAFMITLMRCSGGPFAGYFVEMFGINRVMLLGSLLAAVGISACFFAEDIAAVIVFLGLIHGIGLAFTNTFFPQIVTTHFKKHLTLAFGITQAGACLGSFSSPPLLLWIFRNYGTSGGFLIIGAIVLNGLPIVLFLNILSPNKFYSKSSVSTKYKKCSEGNLEMGVTTKVTSSEGEDNNIKNNVDVKKDIDVKTRKENVVSCKGNDLKNKAVTTLVMDSPKHDYMEIVTGRTDSVAPSPSSELTMISSSMKETGEEPGTDGVKLVFTEFGMISDLKSKNTNHEKKMKEATEEKVNELCACVQYDFKKELNPAKLMTNNCVENQNSSLSLKTFNARSLNSKEQCNQEINQKEVLKIDKKPSTTTDAKKSLKIFLDVTFWIVTVTQSIQVFVLILFWTTMLDFSRDKNIDRSREVYLLMILPIAEIIGRLGLGWITDRKYLTRINFSIFSFIVMSCSCSLMALAEGFYAAMASIFLFGVISSGLTTVFPMIIFEFFDPDTQTMGVASRLCLFGPLSFLNGPLIGYFRGTLGSYVWLYYTMAMASVACAALSSLIPVLARMRDMNKNKKC